VTITLTVSDMDGNQSSCQSTVSVSQMAGSDPCGLFDPCAGCDNPLTNTWTGAVDNDWHNAQNWSTGLVPTACHHVVINSGSVMISNPMVAECYTISVDESAVLDNELGCTMIIMGCASQP